MEIWFNITAPKYKEILGAVGITTGMEFCENILMEPRPFTTMRSDEFIDAFGDTLEIYGKKVLIPYIESNILNHFDLKMKVTKVYTGVASGREADPFFSIFTEVDDVFLKEILKQLIEEAPSKMTQKRVQLFKLAIKKNDKYDVNDVMAFILSYIFKLNKSGDKDLRIPFNKIWNKVNKNNDKWNKVK